MKTIVPGGYGNFGERICRALAQRPGFELVVSGRDAQRAARRSWHIAAGNNHGPEIPCMAAILLAERIAGGSLAAPGAHVAMGWLTLPDFMPEFERWSMKTHIAHERHADGA